MIADEPADLPCRQLQVALRAGRMAAWRIDGAGILAPNPELNVLIGLPPDAQPTLEDLMPNYLPGELDLIRAAAEAARARGDGDFEVEYRYRRADGEVRWFNVRAEALVADGGAAAGVIGVAADITDRKADEERLRFLTREVHHRANNLMAVVGGIVSLSSAETVDELRQVLRGRIHALAHTHQLLAENRWLGAHLGSLLREQLSPFLGDTAPRLSLHGPDVRLQAATAQAVAMTVHELLTNAVKHGSLCSDAGRVDIAWTVESNGRVRLSWTESGGPPARNPERRGLGAMVIQRALKSSGAGEARLDWRPEGLVCDLTFLAGDPSLPGTDTAQSPG